MCWGVAMKAPKRRASLNGLLAVCAGALGIYFAVYAIGSNSEACRRAEAAIRTSPEIASIVGDVANVSLKPLKGFRLAPRRDNFGSAHMSLLISGSKRDALITVYFRETKGAWVIVSATIDGQQVNLH